MAITKAIHALIVSKRKSGYKKIIDKPITADLAPSQSLAGINLKQPTK